MATGREETRKARRTPPPSGQSRDPRRVCKVARGWGMGVVAADLGDFREEEQLDRSP